MATLEYNDDIAKSLTEGCFNQGEARTISQYSKTFLQEVGNESQQVAEVIKWLFFLSIEIFQNEIYINITFKSSGTASRAVTL